MGWASILYLGTTFTLFVVFAAIVARTYSRKRRQRGEAPKYRMLDDD
ncbi:Cbb3-type cytochrome oxidase component FixQ [Geothermobacter ehrlichii]|uniref:Cbb3-type cytochrome oxidase component FixQ n=1 Tax=Geothermobacter ehrlichii TaxID=213224 RepID=A0A5D3WMK5_9BACT|nr:CcoQ/FixQ family Cbb3-type cytochrome c oxidase assembly chaperone [Geothermobacter ehrlichii]TYO98776.1 Cbb3-type cytochrome oxidase component FixQ [Geothermobacter ehrlichii]